MGGEDGGRDNVDLDRRLHSYFRLDDDLERVYAQLAGDPVAARAIELYPGLRLLRQEPWECLASYICSGANSLHCIQAGVEKIAQLSHEKVRLGAEERHVFPTAQEVVDTGRETPAGLRLGLERHRSLRLMAIQVVDDPMMLDHLAQPSISACEAVTLLDSYRGIGPKMASCVALMSLEKLDAFPVDRWVQRALDRCDLSSMAAGLAERVRSLRRLTGHQQYVVAEWAGEHFGEYAGYAGQYPFHWIEPGKERRGRVRAPGDAYCWRPSCCRPRIRGCPPLLGAGRRRPFSA